MTEEERSQAIQTVNELKTVSLKTVRQFQNIAASLEKIEKLLVEKKLTREAFDFQMQVIMMEAKT